MKKILKVLNTLITLNACVCIFSVCVCVLCVCVLEEAATVLGKDEVLLARVTEWCEAKDHAGVRGEANRLFAALLRHSRSDVSSSNPHPHLHPPIR